MQDTAIVLSPLLAGIILLGITEGKSWWEIFGMSMATASLILALYGVA